MLEDLKKEYRLILESHLAGAGEVATLQAYDFARRCLREGLAPDDVVALHIDLVENELLRERCGRADSAGLSLLLEIVMAFSLSYRQTVDGLERANKELESTSHFKSRMLSMVAHDLTNHITAIKLLARATLRDATDTVVSERLQHMLRAVEEEEHLVANLLDIGRIESGRLQLDRRPVPLFDVIERCVERARELTAVHTFSVCGPRTAVMADRATLPQIVDNLLANAIKYSPEGGLIAITLTIAGDHVTTEITDHGLGIAAADLPHLFEPFYRGTTAEHAQIPGTGLGLAIVRSLLKLQQGTVDVTSTPGEGSTFRFTLPLAPAAVVGSPAPTTSEPSETAR